MQMPSNIYCCSFCTRIYFIWVTLHESKMDQRGKSKEGKNPEVYPTKIGRKQHQGEPMDISSIYNFCTTDGCLAAQADTITSQHMISISMPARQPTAWGIYLYYKCSAFSVFKMIGWKPIETPMSIFNRRVSQSLFLHLMHLDAIQIWRLHGTFRPIQGVLWGLVKTSWSASTMIYIHISPELVFL